MQNIKTLYKSLVSHSLDWSSAVKRGNTLAPLFLRMVVLVVGQLSVQRVKIVFGFARRVTSMYRYQGQKGLAMYLKTCSVLLQQSIGGMKGTAPFAIGMNVARTRQGFPRIIDRRDRRLIQLGDVTVIRLWLSLFGLYRVLDFRGKLKLKTITQPGLDLSSNGVLELWARWLPTFFLKLEQETKLPVKARLGFEMTPNLIPLIRKSSPNSGGLSSVAALPLDIVNWALAPESLQRSFSRYLQEVDGLELVWGLKPFINKVKEMVVGVRERYTQCVRVNPLTRNPFVKDPQRCHHGPWEPESTVTIVTKQINPLESTWGPVMALGRLGFKFEPGKIRVFAMVDALTQALLHPLHKWIFTRLGAIRTDGTFDQTAPIERLIKRMNDPSKCFVASYDLSAATDRLPVVLQEMILEGVGTAAFARHWKNLLVGRPYKLPKEAKSWNLGFSEVVYAVGQPMGAYSSWAMLALTHHAIVQLAAHRVSPSAKRGGWFLDYAVLGDDIVIANKAVANEYLRLMSLIGVEIGLAKSLVSSQGTFEFAKRTYFKGQEVSAMSLAEVSVALSNLTSLMELVRKNLKFARIRVSSVARFAGYGYRNLARLQVIWAVGNRLGRLSACLHAPGSVWPTRVIEWISAVGPGAAIKDDAPLWRVAMGVWTELINRAVTRIVKIEQLLPSIGLYSYSYGEDRPKTEEERKKEFRGKLRNGLVAVQGYLGIKGKGLEGVFSENAFNDFFLEWVARPYHDKLWNRVKKVDGMLREHSPYILPSWKDLDALWSELFDYNSESGSFPTRAQLLSRKNDDISVREGGRILRLWLKLRRIVRSGSTVTLSLAASTRTWPKAMRRWDRGLGQDRVNMADSANATDIGGSASDSNAE